MFSTMSHRQYQATVALVAMYNQKALRGCLNDDEKAEHEKLIAQWKTYEQSWNYKFFLTISQIRHSKAMASFYYIKRNVGNFFWAIGYDIRQAFKKKA